MEGKSHLVTGVTSASWAAVALAATGMPANVCLLSIPVGAYSALLPDLDHPKATATWSLPPLSNALSWVIRGAPYDFALPITGWGGAGRLLPWRVTHRGVTHREEASIVFGIIFGLPFCLLPAPFGGWTGLAFVAQVIVGCLTHDWGDLRTSGGLQARGGHPRERRTIGRTFDTGSDYEGRLRTVVYRPVAFISAAVSSVAVVYLSTT
jgi:membrane-bound metal-dependent hydrolase YbcI (DUF457 family)